MTDQAERVLVAAKAIALVYGDKWEDLDDPAKLHYRKEAYAGVAAIDQYDWLQKSRKIREGKAKSTRPRNRNVGRPTQQTAEHDKAREMLRDQNTTRAIREATGLGNSTISRLKHEIQKAKANVLPSASVSKPAPAGAMPVQNTR